MTTFAPIAYAREHVIFDRAGRSASLYRLPTETSDLLPVEEKWALLVAVAGVALAARADLTIMRVHRQHPIDRYVDQAASLVDPRFQDPRAWRRYLEAQVPRLRELDTYQPEVYLRVAHEKPLDHGNAWRMIDRGIRKVNEALGVGVDAPVSHRDIDQRVRIDELLLDRLWGAMPGIRPVTCAELQWLCKRAATAGVAEPRLDRNWAPDAYVILDEHDEVAYQPVTSDFRALYACVTRRGRADDLDYLEVRGDGPTTYQAFVTLGKLPTDVDFPGQTAEYMSAPVTALGSPVDSVTHCEWVVNKRALREVRRKLRNADIAIRDAIEAARDPDARHALAPELARDLESVLLGDDRPAMLDATVSYRLTAPTFEQLHHDVDLFREQFSGIAVFMAPGEQERLFHAHLPSPTTVVTDWAQRISLDQLGMALPTAGHGVGDPVGAYFGDTMRRGRPRSPVLVDATRAAQDAQPSVIGTTGRMGAAKTVSMQRYATLAAMRGSLVYTLDPGGDHFITDLPQFAGRARIVEIAAREDNRGSLDALVTAPRELCEDVALAYAIDLLREVDAAGERELRRAIRDARLAGTGMLGAIAVLKAGNPVARDLGEHLEIASEFGLGVLGFSDGRCVQPDGDLPQVVTFRPVNLGLPSANQPRHTYDTRQRAAVATFKLLAAHILGRLTEDRSVHKVFYLDEGWVLVKSEDGGTLGDQMIRLARKNNATVIVSSQTATDLASLRDLITNYMVFGVTNADEAARALDLVGLDPDDPRLQSMLVGFEKGRCLMCDGDGRVDEVQVHVPPDELAILRTEPGTRPRPEAVVA